MKTEAYVCQSCRIDVIRPVTKGQRPKWCPDCRARGAWNYTCFTCAGCGVEADGTGKKYCSVTCSNRAKPTRTRKPKPVLKTADQLAASHRAMRSPMRAAFEDGDGAALLEAIRADSEVVGAGCWRWSRRIKDGYPVVRLGGKYLQVHRLSLEAQHQAPLGSQHAHHKCANSWCVNPDHLQPVTHRENIAEMMARQSYLARIRELEAALAHASPDHPLLSVVAVA